MRHNLLAVAAVAVGLVAVQVTGTPKEVKGAFNLEPARNGKPYAPIMVPPGCDTNIALNCKVTSSDPNLIKNDKLSFVTDGDKEIGSHCIEDKENADTVVELDAGTQWVQIDLGKECVIYGVCVWHFFGSATVYFDVICQISNDPDFIDDVVTVFNNDHDNSSQLGFGKDKEYLETNQGRPIPVDAVKGRYVRFYSRGNTTNKKNHYTEIEVYGRDAQGKAPETEERVPVKIRYPKILFS